MPKLITASYKQRQFVKQLLKHGNIKKAALESYDATEASAYKLGRETLAKPTTQAYMKRLMDEHKVTDEIIVDSLKALLEAGTSEASLKRATPSDAINVIREIAKLKDLYPAEKHKIEKSTISLNLEGKTNEDVQKMIDDTINDLKSIRKLKEKYDKGTLIQDGVVIENANIVP